MNAVHIHQMVAALQSLINVLLGLIILLLVEENFSRIGQRQNVVLIQHQGALGSLLGLDEHIGHIVAFLIRGIPVQDKGSNGMGRAGIGVDFHGLFSRL